MAATHSSPLDDRAHLTWSRRISVVVSAVGSLAKHVVGLPSTVKKEISDFTPYYFKGTFPQGLAVDQKNIHYSGGVLFFQVRSVLGDTITVSEQVLPREFATMKPTGSQTVDNVDGNASISSRDGRVIGTFISDSRPATLISLNAESSVDGSVLKKILQALKPV